MTATIPATADPRTVVDGNGAWRRAIAALIWVARAQRRARQTPPGGCAWRAFPGGAANRRSSGSPLPGGLLSRGSNSTVAASDAGPADDPLSGLAGDQDVTFRRKIRGATRPGASPSSRRRYVPRPPAGCPARLSIQAPRRFPGILLAATDFQRGYAHKGRLLGTRSHLLLGWARERFGLTMQRSLGN